MISKRLLGLSIAAALLACAPAFAVDEQVVIAAEQVTAVSEHAPVTNTVAEAVAVIDKAEVDKASIDLFTGNDKAHKTKPEIVRGTIVQQEAGTTTAVVTGKQATLWD